MRKIYGLISALVLSISIGCSSEKKIEKSIMQVDNQKKTVVYQVFTRLFGNTNTTNKPWGTI